MVACIQGYRRLYADCQRAVHCRPHAVGVRQVSSPNLQGQIRGVLTPWHLSIARQSRRKCGQQAAGRASRKLTVNTRAMVNVDFASPSLVLGAILIGCGVLLLQMRNMQTRVSRDADIVIAAMISIVGSTLIFQGWRLDPLLLLCQALTTSVAVWYGIETFKLRSKEEELESQVQPPAPNPSNSISAQSGQQSTGSPLSGGVLPQQQPQLPMQQVVPEWMNVFGGMSAQAQQPMTDMYPMQQQQQQYAMDPTQMQPPPSAYLPPAQSQPYPYVQADSYEMRPSEMPLQQQDVGYSGAATSAPWEYGAAPAPAGNDLAYAPGGPYAPGGFYAPGPYASGPWQQQQQPDVYVSPDPQQMYASSDYQAQGLGEQAAYGVQQQAAAAAQYPEQQTAALYTTTRQGVRTREGEVTAAPEEAPQAQVAKQEDRGRGQSSVAQNIMARRVMERIDDWE